MLCVDDEELILRFQERLLRKLGYTVTVAPSSVEALRLVREAPNGFDLLITDQTMPRMTGAQLISAVRKICPELPVILCSGFAALAGESVKDLGVHALRLPKPLDARTLADGVRKALG